MAMQDFSASLPMLLYRALDVLMPRFRRIFKEFGLTEQQWRVLRVLWEHQEIALGELANLTLIPPPSLVGVVDRLQAGGLVSRRRSERDRRVLYVTATRSGVTLQKKVQPRVNAAYADLRASVDPAAWEQLVAGLEQVLSVEHGYGDTQSGNNKR